MHRFALPLSLILTGSLLLCGCQKQTVQYHIGFSQCLDDAWRRTMNDEMARELTLHPEVALHTRIANGSNEVQCAQIDSFVLEGVDLLIVSPNEAEAVRPAISRAYRAGIPVVVADRRIDGDEWTAFVGGDNLKVGHLLGMQLCDMARTKRTPIHMFEVTGVPGSTPARLRHAGLLEVILGESRIVYEGHADGQWFEHPAEQLMDSVLRANPRIDVVVAHNDLMAMGARAAADKCGRAIYIMGVDALSGPHGGLQAIVDGVIDVSATYYSRGDLVMQRALQILQGEPFVRDTVLPTDLIYPDAAALLLKYSHRVDHEIETIRGLQKQAIQLGDEIEMQHLLLQLLVALLVLTILIIIFIYYAIRYQRRVKAEREQKEQLLRHQNEQLKSITEELAMVKATMGEEAKFMQKLQNEIEQHMSDPDLDVVNLSDKIGMSRTSLYRKVKAATGYTPTELLRHIRLVKGRQLLRETDMSIQQITYDIGFSSPSYFTKCYRQEYGISPKDEDRKLVKKQTK